MIHDCNNIVCKSCEWQLWCDKTHTNCLIISDMLQKQYANVMHSRRFTCQWCAHRSECDFTANACRTYGEEDAKKELKNNLIERAIR